MIGKKNSKQSTPDTLGSTMVDCVSLRQLQGKEIRIGREERKVGPLADRDDGSTPKCQPVSVAVAPLYVEVTLRR